MKTKTIRAYHFTGKNLRDGSFIPDKKVWLKHKGDLIPCKNGFHASIHPFDALKYALGNTLHLVEVRGDIEYHNRDKVVARERRILQSIDAEKLMHEFARWTALRVIHQWVDAPKVVLDYLNTGDESLRAAARAAASAAAMGAAWAAARDAAVYTVSGAVRDTVMYAAWAAASEAAETIAWNDISRAAERDMIWKSARDAFIKKSRIKFNQMVKKAFKL